MLILNNNDGTTTRMILKVSLNHDDETREEMGTGVMRVNRGLLEHTKYSREVRRRAHDDSGSKVDLVAEPLKSTDYTLCSSYNKTFRMVSPILLLPMLIVNKKVGECYQYMKGAGSGCKKS